jgi:cohesin complex subunit SA-1/2
MGTEILTQQRKDAKLLATLLAEQRLCELTGKIITAVLGGIMSAARARPRLERNRLRLGPNFKEVCAYFDIEDVQAKKAGRKGATKGKAANAKSGKAKPSGKPSAKSNAIVAEDEEDDEIEDPEDDDPDVLKRRGLAVEEDVEDEDVAEDGAGAEEQADEVESVLGD